MIPYGRQDITAADIDAVSMVLRSEFLTQGPMVPRFEDAVAAQVGAQHAVAVNSATSALHLACMALGLGPGDILWTVPNTFVASANCGRYCGADVDFVDIEPQTWNLDVAGLSDKLAAAAKANRLPKVIVAVHFSGQPTEQDAIWELARDYGVHVIEDASHSIGASRHGEPVGSCRWSDITVFSFHPVKIVTTCEGGMAMTNQPLLAERMQSLRTHGITRDSNRFEASPEEAGHAGPSVPTWPPWYYEQQTLGYNYRLTDVHAALGLSQIQRLQVYVGRRNALADRYTEALTDLPIQLPTVLPGNRSAWHLYVIRLKLDRISKTHYEVFDALRQAGVGVNLHYMPVHLQPYYQRLGFRRGQYPEAEAYGETAITLPLYATLSDGDQDYIIRTLSLVLTDH